MSNSALALLNSGKQKDVQIEQDLDPLAIRTQHFTMKVNDYDLAVLNACARAKHTKKASIIRHCLEQYARDHGII
jgi:Leu/Phe-tRNA-protein transferase